MVQNPYFWTQSDCIEITKGFCSQCFYYLNVLLCVTYELYMYSKWSIIWSLQTQMISFNRKYLKSYIQANCADLNFALEDVSRETTLWRKQERFFFCCCFSCVQNNDNNPAMWISTYKPDYLGQYVSYNDLSCHFLSLIHKYTLSHMHIHKYYSSSLISEMFGLHHKHWKQAAKLQLLVLFSVLLCLFFSRDKRRIKTPLSYCQKAN